MGPGHSTLGFVVIVVLYVVIGLMASYGLSRYLETLLFGVQARDWIVFSAVTVLLLAVAALACYIPARRATRIDPMVALRV